MILHRPFGSGHPYSVDTEQRWPVDPEAGTPLTLGVRASPDVGEVVVELERDGDPAGTLALSRAARTSRGQVLDGGHLASAQARLARAAGGWQCTLDGLSAGERWRYRFRGAGQRTRWFDFTVCGWEPAGNAVREAGTSRVLPGSVERLTDGNTVRRVRFALPLAPGERVVGFGERFDALDQRGSALDSVVFEQYKSQGRERKTYLPMPFAHVLGGFGWGFHLRTSRRVWFDVGSRRPDRLEIEAEVGDDGCIGIAFYEGAPREVLDAFLAETGRPELLPEWVFRLWASGNEWNTQSEVMRQADLHRDLDIPVGAIVIEAWSDESTFTVWRDARYEPRTDGGPLRLADFIFPEEGAWPDPKGMIDELHDRDVRLLLWQIPLIKMRPHPAGQAKHDAEAAIRENVLIREPAPTGGSRPYRNRGWWFPLALMPDLTDERAADWWTEKRRYLVEDLGVDGFKTDGGEHAWGRELQYLDGRSGAEANNTFPVAYAKAYGDLLRSAGKAPVTFSRAGYTGAQSHGAVWAGDENSTWEAFRWSLLAGLNASASGILYWGWDLAGFSGEVPDSELYLRSAAAAAFVPIMQYHSEFNHHRKPSRDRTPWNIAERSGNARVIDVFRRFAKLRERLLPYLAGQARASIDAGLPLMRPLFFVTDDDRVWEHQLQWLLGDDLLVAPVVAPGARTWPVFVPEGDWVDAWTGSPASGGAVVERAVPIDELPLYVRAEAWDRMSAVFAGA